MAKLIRPGRISAGSWLNDFLFNYFNVGINAACVIHEMKRAFLVQKNDFFRSEDKNFIEFTCSFKAPRENSRTELF